MMIPEPYVCAFCLEEPAARDCDRTEGGGHWLPLTEVVRRRLLRRLREEREAKRSEEEIWIKPLN